MIEFEDNSKEVKRLFEEATLRALQRCGMQAEGYAQDLVPVDTGNLRNSISHKVDPEEPSVYIGTNNEYASYVELGTGKYAETGGRQEPWVYQDSEGKWHYTHGQKAQPYLRPAVADHTKTYQAIIEQEMENA